MTGITYGILTACSIALYTFNDTVAVKKYTISPLVLTLATNFFECHFTFPVRFCRKEMN
jgi:hypothetical protein